MAIKLSSEKEEAKKNLGIKISNIIISAQKYVQGYYQSNYRWLKWGNYSINLSNKMLPLSLIHLH